MAFDQNLTIIFPSFFLEKSIGNAYDYYMIYRSYKDSIGKAIKEIMEKKGVSLYRMAKDLGINYASLYRSLKEDANPEWKRIKQILDYLDYEFVLRPKRTKTQGTTSPSKSGRQKEE